MNLIDLSQLNAEQVRAIWALVDTPCQPLQRKVAWSLKATVFALAQASSRRFKSLACHLSSCPICSKHPRELPIWPAISTLYDAYVVRESNHQRLAEFAFASQRPVIIAMSGMGHPCEVLTDAF